MGLRRTSSLWKYTEKRKKRKIFERMQISELSFTNHLYKSDRQTLDRHSFLPGRFSCAELAALYLFLFGGDVMLFFFFFLWRLTCFQAACGENRSPHDQV